MIKTIYLFTLEKLEKVFKNYPVRKYAIRKIAIFRDVRV